MSAFIHCRDVQGCLGRRLCVKTSFCVRFLLVIKHYPRWAYYSSIAYMRCCNCKLIDCQARHLKEKPLQRKNLG